MSVHRRQHRLHTTQRCYQLLALVCHVELADENKALIALLGGVELVLSALRKHASLAGVQESGLATLSNLAMNGAWWIWWLRGGYGGC